MTRKLLTIAVMTALATPMMTVPDMAVAKTYHYKKAPKRHYTCKKSSGTTGLVAGAAGGGLIANALGAGTGGTIIAAAGGALLGRHLDKKHDAAQNRRNGC